MRGRQSTVVVALVIGSITLGCAGTSKTPAPDAQEVVTTSSATAVTPPASDSASLNEPSSIVDGGTYPGLDPVRGVEEALSAHFGDAVGPGPVVCTASSHTPEAMTCLVPIAAI